MKYNSSFRWCSCVGMDIQLDHHILIQHVIFIGYKMSDYMITHCMIWFINRKQLIRTDSKTLFHSNHEETQFNLPLLFVFCFCSCGRRSLIKNVKKRQKKILNTYYAKGILVEANLKIKYTKYEILYLRPRTASLHPTPGIMAAFDRPIGAESMHAVDSETGPTREGPADTCPLGCWDRCASLWGGIIPG